MPFVVGLLIVGAIWYWSIQRGKLTIRAASYLVAIANEASPEEANRFAFSIDTYEAAKRKHEAMEFVREVYGGKQLALISSARMMGFRG